MEPEGRAPAEVTPPVPSADLRPVDRPGARRRAYRLLPRWRRRSAPAPTQGTVRLDRRTKDLTKRLQPGEVAVIHHSDLDRVSAEALVAQQPSAVVNAVASVSGRYPNLGPGIVLSAGIVLIDDAGEEIFSRLTEGDQVIITDGQVRSGDTVVAEGTVLTVAALEEQRERARLGLSDQIEAFAKNTLTYLRDERDLLLEGVGVPEIDTRIEGRHVLIVVRGYDYRTDLETLRPYISERRPLLLGVDGGADALLEARYRPDIILGDMDSVSDKALRCGAELIVHAYPDGRAPGQQRLEKLGLQAKTFPALGTSEDAAMMLADTLGARVLVAVGTHASLVEFLDKGREGMASTFLTRLRVGAKLVDAKGVSRIYQSTVRGWQLALLVVAGLLALGVSMATTDVGRAIGQIVVARFHDFAYWIRGLFT